MREIKKMSKKLEKFGGYIALGLVKTLPYIMELAGIMYVVDGINKKDPVIGFGGAALYVMGDLVKKGISNHAHLPREKPSDLPKLMEKPLKNIL